MKSLHGIALVWLAVLLLVIVPVCLRVGRAFAMRDEEASEARPRARKRMAGANRRMRRLAAQRRPLVLAVERCAEPGVRELSDSELENARRLVAEGTEDSARLAAIALGSCTRADLAAVFTPAVIQRVASAADPKCWPPVANALRSMEPWLELLKADVAARLEASRESVWLDAGFMGHVFPNPGCQPPYRVLLEQDFPPGFVTSLGHEIRAGVSESRLNMNMYASYYVYSFPCEVLTAVSTDGCRVLAELSAQARTTLPAPPFWEPYGEHLLLARITELSDEAADALSHAKRSLLFGKLRTFPDTPGHVKLARRLAIQRHVVLGESTQLSPAVAGILSSAKMAPPSKLHEILYCDMVTEQDRNRAAFVSIGGGIPNILQ